MTKLLSLDPEVHKWLKDQGNASEYVSNLIHEDIKQKKVDLNSLDMSDKPLCTHVWILRSSIWGQLDRTMTCESCGEVRERVQKDNKKFDQKV